PVEQDLGAAALLRRSAAHRLERLLLRLFVAVALLAGCVQTAALDSARSLPRGKKVALPAAAADVQGRARHPTHLPSSERWDDPPPPEKREWQQYRVIPKIAYAFRLGLGAGAQLDV